MITKHISIIMPTYNQSRFISRAINSVLKQTYENWELIIINDGSTDNTEEVVESFLSNKKITYLKNNKNKGLGYALNLGLDSALGDYIAYLPSDDIFFKDHMQTLAETLEETQAIAVYSGLKHHYNRIAEERIDGYPLQLVQIMHDKTSEHWMEREELVTDDLEQMFWNKLRKYGEFVGTGKVTCEWVDHPHQLHKIIREPLGGINPYKQYYNVNQPLRYHSTVGNFIDEIAQYKQFRDKTITPKPDGLKIVLVGELAYNADRVVALAEQGHTLYGLWMKDTYWYNTVGPVPFGHVQDIPYENWKETIDEIKPDIIYALLNWQAVPFAHEILTNNSGIPFVWHFKEGPFICLEKGTWKELIDLYQKSDGQIYVSDEMREWFREFLATDSAHELILDGDLPKREWFTDDRSPLLSERDHEIHTVVPGRPIGLHPHTVAELASHKIHLHFYGDFTHGQWKQWIEKTERMAPGYLHTHPNVDQRNWVKEFSQYDAGWLHFFKSENNGEWSRANWDDLNIPARISTLAAAGLPMLQQDNAGHVVATQSIVRAKNLGIFFTDIANLAEQLHDIENMSSVRESVWKNRDFFTFDSHVEELVQFFRKVISTHEYKHTKKAENGTNHQIIQVM